MKTYQTPTLVEFGSVAQLTADSGENSNSDTIFRLNGRTGPGIGGSMDSCNFTDNRCLPGDGVIPRNR